jgi:hypothetical protein
LLLEMIFVSALQGGNTERPNSSRARYDLLFMFMNQGSGGVRAAHTPRDPWG